MRSGITRQGWRSGLGVLALALVTSGCAQTDAGIQSAVKAQLAADESVPAEDLVVEVDGGVVTLHGAVDTQVARTRALEIARETTGVRDVVDELRLIPGAAPTTGTGDPEAGIRTTDPQWRESGGGAERAGDAAVTTAVRTSLLEDTSLAGLNILVSTRASVVTLSGRVPSLTEKHRAIERARETEGVKSVVDRLRVERDLDK